MTSPFDKTGIFMNSELVGKVAKNDSEEVRVSVLKNNKIDVRSYVYFQGEPEAKPTKKGVWLSFRHIPAVTAALAKISENPGGEEETLLEENDKGKLKIYSAAFKGRVYAHIRNFYSENGEFKPGKGVSFAAELAPRILEVFGKLKGRKE